MPENDTCRRTCACAARPTRPLAALIFDMHMGHVSYEEAKRRMDQIVPPVDGTGKAAA